MKASRTTSKSQSESRLSSCAAVLRLAVEVGIRKLKSKTVKALVDHITQTLPTSNEGYCEPLSLGYLRSLRLIVEYQPHVEHLHRDEWLDLVDFCIEGIMLAFRNAGSNTLGPYGSQSVTSGTQRSSSNLAGTSTRARVEVATQDSANGQDKNNVEELVLCLYHLTSATNAPVLEKAQAVLVTLMDLLHSSASVGIIPQVAFGTMNRLLAKTSTNDVTLTQQFVKEVLPLIRQLWPIKSHSLKDEMLVMLVHAKLYILKLSSTEDAESFGTEVEGLFESMQAEYSRRVERDLLLLDDLVFSTRSRAVHRPVPLSIAGVHLRMGTVKTEQNWATPQTIGFLLSILQAYETARLKHDALASEEDSRRKRQRMVQQLDDLLRQTKNSHLTGRLCALQVIPFVLDQTVTTGDVISGILECLLSCISDKNGTIASWAMIGIARYASRSLP